MNDREFIEKVREIAKIPGFIKDEEFTRDFQSDDLEYMGTFIDHQVLLSSLIKEYDENKKSDNNESLIN